MSALICLALVADLVVATQGGDYTSIQDAMNAAQPGDRVLVREKLRGWNERVVFARSGSETAGSIELMAFPGEAPVLDATRLLGQWMVTIQDKSHVRVAGLEFRNNVATGDGSGVHIAGAGSLIQIEGCTFHDFTGSDSMAITVYGTSTVAPIEDLVIRENTIYDCAPAQSEALVLNGNVRGFLVEGNLVRDVNNIGIDFIGGETSINPAFGAREDICRGTTVVRARSNYGGGFGDVVLASYLPVAPGVIDGGNTQTYLNARGGVELEGETLHDFRGADRMVDVRSVPDRLTSTHGAAPDLGAVEFSPAIGTEAVRRLCSPLATSYGEFSRVAAVGDLSISSNSLSLRGSNPVGEGIICIQGGAFRLPATPSSSVGVTKLALDLTQIAPGIGLAPGDTWVFQHWFRDPSGGPSGSNFSDAVEITFAP